MKKLNFEPLRLGELIEKLTPIKKDKHVYFDWAGCIPRVSNGRAQFSIYRGYYSDLALEYEAGEYMKFVTVGELLEGAKSVRGQDLTSWKGGKFHIDSDTIIWVANLGNCMNTALVGVKEKDSEVILVTRHGGDAE